MQKKIRKKNQKNIQKCHTKKIKNHFPSVGNLVITHIIKSICPDCTQISLGFNFTQCACTLYFRPSLPTLLQVSFHIGATIRTHRVRQCLQYTVFSPTQDVKMEMCPNVMMSVCPATLDSPVMGHQPDTDSGRQGHSTIQGIGS